MIKFYAPAGGYQNLLRKNMEGGMYWVNTYFLSRPSGRRSEIDDTEMSMLIGFAGGDFRG